MGVGGGFIGFEKFLELYATEELEKLLSYEIDDRTGAPKFSEALKVRQTVEESGLLDDLRERAQQQANSGKGPLSASEAATFGFASSGGGAMPRRSQSGQRRA